MKRFRFPLERVRKWRQDQAGLEEMRLQALYSDIGNLHAEQRRIAEETEQSCRGILQQSTVSAQDLATLEDYRLYTARENRRIAARKRDIEARIVEQRRRVLDARRKCQLLDGLRDKALISWTASQDKEQEDLAAELFLAKRQRK
jgi:hypothetical protein